MSQNQLPKLRSDLNLYPAGAAENGSPNWVLHDPAANRFYRLGWLEFEIIKRWYLGQISAIIKALKRETMLQPSQIEVSNMLQFLADNQLVEKPAREATQEFLRLKQQQQKKFFSWLIKNYLFFRIPLAIFIANFCPFF